MKKTFLKRKSKNPRKKLIDIADRALQDWYRKEYPNEPCLVCGNKTDLRHHFIDKSRSNRLRYEPINLIPLCFKCHYKAHFGSENLIGAEIQVKKGKKWLEKIKQIEKEHITLPPKVLEEIIRKYQ